MKKQKRLWTAAAVCAVLGATCRAVPGIRFAGLLFRFSVRFPGKTRKNYEFLNFRKKRLQVRGFFCIIR